MAKEYIESGRASLTGEFISRKGAVAYGEFYSDRRPDGDDDELAGFAEGSVWHYVDRQRVYICVDPTEGEAVWRDLRDAAKVTVICRNNTGSTITKGSIVYVTGATGNRPTIALADKDSEETSSKTLGMVVADILNNADGSVAVNGTVDDLDTSAYAAGTPLYLGDNGALTATEPVSPAHSVFIGWVAISNANNGRVILHIQNGYELDELHDVLITTPTDGQVLAYEASTSLWKNVRRRRSLYQTATPVDVDTDADDVLTVSIPAGLLSTNGDAVKANIFGRNIDPTCKVEFWFGGTKRQSYDTLGSGNWSLDIELFRRSNTEAVGKFSFIGEQGAVVYLSALIATSLNLTTTAYDFVIRLDSTAGDVISLDTATVEFLPAP
jgi:hypothetical protein